MRKEKKNGDVSTPILLPREQELEVADYAHSHSHTHTLIITRMCRNAPNQTSTGNLQPHATISTHASECTITFTGALARAAQVVPRMSSALHIKRTPLTSQIAHK